MKADHSKTMCEVHGTIYSECRCPSGTGKMKYRVPCVPSLCGEQTLKIPDNIVLGEE